MPVFDILCLANSNKRRGSCIAGLRLDGGGWIRPVARTPHGELYPAHYALQDGSCPKLFDRIRIPFLERRAFAHQPENWLIADHPWQLISRGLFLEFAPLLQSHLINRPALFGDSSRRMLSGRFEAQPAMSSLCLIRPGNLRWRIDNLPYNAHKASAQFELAGTSYCLPVTDPARLSAFRALSPGEYPVTACGIAAELAVLLTISLGDPWEDGYCYKLVAGILPLEASDSCAARTTQAAEETRSDRPAHGSGRGRLDRPSFADGTDPHTREPLPGDSPCSHLDTVRALRTAALRSDPPRKKQCELPAQAGRGWDTAEEDTLVRGFEAGETLAAIARVHGRTPGAIRCRLIRLGKLADWP